MQPKTFKSGMEIDNCYVVGMPEDYYHSTSGFISKSSLAALDSETPLRFFSGVKREPTAAMKIGTAIHCAILEPMKFKDTYMLMPEVHAKTLKEYKDAVKENPSMIVINGNDAKNIEGMAKAIRSNDSAKLLLGLDGWCEISGFHTDLESGVKLRHRFDKLSLCGVGIDLKKTQSVRPDELAKTIAKYSYEMQDSLYSDAYQAITGKPLNAFYFVFVEESYPHQVAVVYLDDISKQVGRDSYKRLLSDYVVYSQQKSSIMENNDEIKMISLPEWKLRQYENELENGGVY